MKLIHNTNAQTLKAHSIRIETCYNQFSQFLMTGVSAVLLHVCGQLDLSLSYMDCSFQFTGFSSLLCGISNCIPTKSAHDMSWIRTQINLHSKFQVTHVCIHVQLDERLTYMDWTFPYTGLDFSYVWDPEMWIKFREAVKWNTPEVFWNKIWDRIAYSELLVHIGCTAIAKHIIISSTCQIHLMSVAIYSKCSRLDA